MMLPQDFARRLYYIENSIRDLASKIEHERIEHRDAMRILHNISTITYWLQRGVERLVEYLHQLGVSPERMGKLYTVDSTVRHVYVTVDEILTSLHKIALQKKEHGPKLDVEIDGKLNKHFRELDEQVYRLTGKHCASRGSNKLSSILKDLASCIHAVAEHLSKIGVKRRYKCNIVKDGKGTAFCLTWSEAVKENEIEELYHEDDFKSLDGWVIGDEVYLKLGKSRWHKAFVDLKKGKLEYSYTDTSEAKIMKDVLEKFAGLFCKMDFDDDQVECTGVTDRNMKKVALALSMATSIENRIDDPEKYWSEKYREIGEKAMMLQRLKWLKEKV